MRVFEESHKRDICLVNIFKTDNLLSSLSFLFIHEIANCMLPALNIVSVWIVLHIVQVFQLYVGRKHRMIREYVLCNSP